MSHKLDLHTEKSMTKNFLLSPPCKRQRATTTKTSVLPRATPTKREDAASTFSLSSTGTSNQDTEPMGLSRCGYRSKLCDNDRALKQNGEFHKLCEYHRRRANLNQQRVHQRRKLRLKHSKTLQEATLISPFVRTPSPRSNGTESLYYAPSTPEIVPGIEPPEVCSTLEPFTSPCGDLSLDDLIILDALLFDSTSSSFLQSCAVMNGEPLSQAAGAKRSSFELMFT